jgi:hypothetical protein
VRRKAASRRRAACGRVSRERTKRG